MKIHSYFLLITSILLLGACSNNMDIMKENPSIQKGGAAEGNIIIQKRDPTLPEVVTKKIILDKMTRSSNANISYEYLGYGYKLLDGNFIAGDFDNVTTPILNLNKIKDYDDSYIDTKPLIDNTETSVAYTNHEEYYHSEYEKKISDTGFNLNLGVFSFGHKKHKEDFFSTFIMSDYDQVFGELDITFYYNKHQLQFSSGTQKLFARQFLQKSFIRNLFSGTIGSVINGYGDFVVLGYYTGGEAHGEYMANTDKNIESYKKEHALSQSMHMSVNFKKNPKDSVSASLSYNGHDGKSDSTFLKNEYSYVFLKTLGGDQSDHASLSATIKLLDLKIDLSAWRKSLKDQSQHTMVGITDQGIAPLSSLVLETNFKQRFENTINGYLEKRNELCTPSLVIEKYIARSGRIGSQKILYDIAPILTTRQGDKIILADGTAKNATDEELIQNGNDAVFMSKVKNISTEISQYFSSQIEISYNKTKYLVPKNISPLCIVVPEFNPTRFKKFYYEPTNMEYLYDPQAKICFSFFADEGDESTLDLYGLEEWGSNLPEHRISIATLANSYTIIGL